jgi:hypothetical protein
MIAFLFTLFIGEEEGLYEDIIFKDDFSFFSGALLNPRLLADTKLLWKRLVYVNPAKKKRLF